MENYKREFIKFLEGAGVLKFGDFTAKSGRKIPYFVNAGEIKTGEQIQKLGEFYAECIREHILSNTDEDNDRPVKANDSYYMLINTPCPTVIVECGFLSNPAELEKNLM